MNSQMKIEVPGVDFTAMAREAIAANLMKALVGHEDIIQKIVASALAQKVNTRGVVSHSSYENTQNYVEWLVGDMVREATTEVLKSKVEQLRPLLEKALEAELKRSLKPAAKALTDCFIRSAGNSYWVKANVGLTFSANKD